MRLRSLVFMGIEDSSDYLKALLNSIGDHRAWEAPPSISIEHSIRDTIHFVDLIGNEGSSRSA
jgi:hypothetical protein